jgi:uncharacterized MnhB-related membrane protein
MTILFAIMAIETAVLRHAVIYAGIYSLLCSFVYLLYQAPDVAIAEAVIGCTLSTVLFLVAIRKYKVYRVYYCYSAATSKKKHDIIKKARHILTNFSLSIELELDFILSKNTAAQVITHSSYDLIIEQNQNQLTIFGDVTNYHFEEIKKWFADSGLSIEYCPLFGQIEDERL